MDITKDCQHNVIYPIFLKWDHCVSWSALEINFRSSCLTLKINEKIIEFVPNFNFLGMNFNENFPWKPHIDNICNKISRSIGILNKLKHYIPFHIRINIYNSLILPYINYGILLWGNNHEKVTKLQKKAMRIIN